jgi:probable HAF family extracellular repeat protein
MRPWTSIFGAVAVALLALASGERATAAALITSYESILFPGSIETHPWDINSAGVVVGEYRLPDRGGFHGFIYSGGVFTTVEAPGADSTTLYGINDQGEVVGEAGGGAITTAFKYSNGVFENITIPGAAGVVALDINNSGEIIGNFLTGSLDAGLEGHLFTLTAGGLTTFEGPHSAAWSEALSNNGSFAGFGPGGFFHNTAGFHEIGGLDPRGLNDLGHIVGQTGTIDGFLFNRGRFEVFDVGSGFTVATGINNEGAIVGYFHDFTDGREKGFLLDRGQVALPEGVPEPSSWIGMLTGFAMLGGAFRLQSGRPRVEAERLGLATARRRRVLDLA